MGRKSITGQSLLYIITMSYYVLYFSNYAHIKINVLAVYLIGSIDVYSFVNSMISKKARIFT